MPPRLLQHGLDRQRLASEMQSRALSGLLLAAPENVYYTTGYTSLPSSGNPILYTLRNRLPFFSFVDGTGRISLICWGFSTEGVEFGADQILGINEFSGALRALEALFRQASTDGGAIAIESTSPYYVGRLLEQVLGTTTRIVDADGLMETLRLRKTVREIELLRRSIQIAEQTVEELFALVQPGLSRLRLMDEARTRLMKNGATGVSHITFTFGRENPEIAIDEILEPSRLVTLDLGAIVDGYCSDNRRYAFVGSLPDSLRARHETIVQIVDAVGAALQPGNSFADVFRRGVELFEQYGVEALDRFNHVGHNIGLETEERWIDDDPRSFIEPGMVINIELYSRAETGEQIGDEETFVIEESGPERISKLPREIRAIP